MAMLLSTFTIPLSNGIIFIFPSLLQKNFVQVFKTPCSPNYVIKCARCPSCCRGALCGRQALICC